MQSPLVLEADTGSLVLTVSRQNAARTILPDWPAEGFAEFRLSLVNAGNPSHIINLIWTESSGTVGGLTAGNWNLTVTAYMDAGGGRPVARGELTVNLLAREVAYTTITLFPISAGEGGGSGTFMWNIGFPTNVVTARMEIRPFNGNGYVHSEIFTGISGARAAGSIPLGTGRYHVIFELYDTLGERWPDIRILRVYQNMVSVFEYNFGRVPVPPLNFVLDSWGNPIPDVWNFDFHEITAWVFGFLGIDGIDDDNFDGVVGWFNYLTDANVPATVPTTTNALKELVDAALIGIARDSIGTGNHGTRAAAEEAIAELVRNGTDIRFAWTGYYTITLTVFVGVYEVEISFGNAVWARPVFTVTFDGNGHTGGTVPNPIEGHAFTTIQLPGHGGLVNGSLFFAGWNTDPDAMGTAHIDYFEVETRNVTLYAIWSEFDFDLGSGTIRGFSGTGENVVIPVTINTVQVTSIGPRVFAGRVLTSITIPGNVNIAGPNGGYDTMGVHGASFLAFYEGNGRLAGTYTFDDGNWILDAHYFVFYDGIIIGFTGASRDIIIPVALGGIPVTGIGSSAFWNRQLTSVVIPDGVTSIGSSAFTSNYLTSVVIPDTVTYIGGDAFSWNQLDSIIIPDGVTSIEWGAFRGNRLTEVVIPNGVTFIGGDAFASNHLTSVFIPASVTSIESSAFAWNQLTWVIIPSGVTSIGPSVFAGNILTSITIPSGVNILGPDGGENTMGTHGISFLTLYNGNGRLAGTYTFDGSRWALEEASFVFVAGTITGFIGTITSIVIPDTIRGVPVTSIGNNAFSGAGLISVIIPASVTSIGSGAFSGNALTSITILGNVNIDNADTMGVHGVSFLAFYNGTGRRVGTYTFDGSNWSFATSSLIFVNGTITGFTCTSRNIVIPPTINGELVTSIGSNAFANSGLLSVVIPTSVTYIGSSAFANNQLSSVIIPDGITSIESSTFAWNQLTEVLIPASVTFIGWDAFAGNQLTSVSIPNSVTFIEGGVFRDNRLTSVNIPVGVTSIGWAAFSNNQLTSVVIPAGVTWIDSSAFAGNLLTSVVIPSGVTFIGGDAFANNQLTSVTIPNSVTSIGGGAFRNNRLTSVDIPLGITSIDWAVFSNNQLASVIIPASVTSIDSSAFSNNLLTSVVIPSGVTSIGSSAFESNLLISVTIPASVTYIGSSAFANNQLTLATIPNSVTSIEGWAFRNNRLTSITIPAGVTSIGPAAFTDNLLTSISLPNSVTFIDGGAFANNMLTSIAIPGNVNVNDGICCCWGWGNAMGIYGVSFLEFYNGNGRLAGIYVFDGSNWTRSN